MFAGGRTGRILDFNWHELTSLQSGWRYYWILVLSVINWDEGSVGLCDTVRHGTTLVLSGSLQCSAAVSEVPNPK